MAFPITAYCPDLYLHFRFFFVFQYLRFHPPPPQRMCTVTHFPVFFNASPLAVGCWPVSKWFTFIVRDLYRYIIILYKLYVLTCLHDAWLCTSETVIKRSLIAPPCSTAWQWFVNCCIQSTSVRVHVFIDEVDTSTEAATSHHITQSFVQCSRWFSRSRNIDSSLIDWRYTGMHRARSPDYYLKLFKAGCMAYWTTKGLYPTPTHTHELWNFRFHVLSPQVELSLSGTFAPRNFRSLELSFPGTFAPVPIRETYNRRFQHDRM